MKRPSMMLAATLACFSTPGKIGDTGVTRGSYVPSAVAPMKTMRSFTRSAPRPWRMSTAGMLSMVPGGPA